MFYVAVGEFFFDGAGIRDDVIHALIGRLQQYREWVESQKSFKMFATSILIVYEGKAKYNVYELLCMFNNYNYTVFLKLGACLLIVVSL